MNDGRPLDRVLKDWPFEPGSVSVRTAECDERQVIQMRIELGILQLETSGRPDGWRPEGCETYYDYLVEREISGEKVMLTEDQCFECDREFVQFYHRRICWLALQEYENAVADADHTLALMDYSATHSPDDQWTLTHEQYRPFVLYHRTQADAMFRVSEERPELAIEAVNRGLKRLRAIFDLHDMSEQFDEDELVQRLVELRESLRDQFEVGRTLREQLSDAIASEQYELAARIRDKLQDKNGPR